jgi:hypothetical protein
MLTGAPAMHSNMELTYEVNCALNSLADNQWAALFKDHPDTSETIRLLDQSGMDGIDFSSLVVRRGEEPVLLLPLFAAHYSLASTLPDPLRQILRALENVAPAVLKPKVLGVGFVEGEWGQIGINSSMPATTIESAMQGAVSFLEDIAEATDCQIIAFKDFTRKTAMALPASLKKRYISAASLPFCQMDVDFSSGDVYLEHLPRKVRQDLRRKLRQAWAVRIEHSDDLGEHAGKAYELYSQLVERSELSFGVHNRLYFEEICRQVPGAHYILFFIRDKLIGFNLVIDEGDCLVDKYIGMDAVDGRANNIYFLAWMEKIRYCTRRGIKKIHLGAAAEDIKVRLGARMIPSFVFFRHRNPLCHMVLSKFAGLLSYEPAVRPTEQTIIRWDNSTENTVGTTVRREARPCF